MFLAYKDRIFDDFIGVQNFSNEFSTSPNLKKILLLSIIPIKPRRPDITPNAILFSIFIIGIPSNDSFGIIKLFIQ